MSMLDENSMLFWYPKIKGLDIPQPRTEIYEFDDEDRKHIDNLEISDKIYNAVYTRIRGMGFPDKPVFIRTDQSSCKHSWSRTCYVSRGGANYMPDIRRMLFELLDCNFMQDLYPSAIMIREYIEMASQFTAYDGNLPISPERRYFIRDGKVECHHPYWIEDAIMKWISSVKAWGEIPHIPEGWKKKLAKMNTESQEEIALLTSYAEQVGKALEGYWSVDFCLSRKGTWYLIDCALGEYSWHDERCMYCKRGDNDNE